MDRTVIVSFIVAVIVVVVTIWVYFLWSREVD